MSVAAGSFAQTANSIPVNPAATPTPVQTPSAEQIEQEVKPLVEALERCQGEVKASRTRIKLLEKHESDLIDQINTEKENGRLGSAAYEKAVKELAEVRASLDSAKKELQIYKAEVKKLKKKIGHLRAELVATGIGSGALILFLLFLLL